MLEYFISKEYESYFKLIPDIEGIIVDVLEEFVANEEIDVIVTCGGTGCTERDVTPEATLQIIKKQIPGLSEKIRTESASYTPNSYLSRGVSGIVDKTVIINLPGSPTAALQSFQIVEPLLEHLVDQVKNGAKEHEEESTGCGCSCVEFC